MELVGLISSTDLMKLRLDAYGTPDADNAEYLDAQFSISDVMSTELRTIGSHEPVRAAAEKLSSGDHHSSPVVDADKGLVGIVTTTDLVNYLLAQY